MMTDAEQRARITDDALEKGGMPSVQELIALCEDAEHAEHLEGIFDSLRDALEQEGYGLIDMTTDDDDAPVFHLVVRE